MLDHIGLVVSDLERSRRFYLAALPPLGIGVEMEVTAEETGGHAHLGLGTAGKPFFWVSGGAAASGPIHVAFTATTRAAVDAFHAAALAAGGRDNGGPGLRPHYHPNYYAAFVFDPDGNNIEAVCHTPA
ncbi:catechol 2,3-dioxygenase-like lactoylglutathione lyase family enzyme [Humitalea rosea]|uniref:Catechol 2,3-dioxygenase-like lactoylglutathione lyase family enzyme n=1 Tax=Humitalea rosea TaxID=990373 RepID=A0A2W7J6P6_9PROT|nr:VOC family protein [Humitalea rosea]PZW46882.1 catechol 2,3-dioxygenase-like lactoylglutathione lyase family enzyme [Humitalea rosea]